MSSPIDANPARLKHIYNNYRDVLLSRDYYACRLVYLKRCNLYYEVILALGASGSLITGWYIWKTSYGQPVWASLSGVAAVLAILKPIIKISEEVGRYSKLYTGYADLAYDYKQLVNDIKIKSGISEESRRDAVSAEKRFKSLCVDDDPRPSEKLLRECQRAIKRRVPKFDDWLSS
jgi:hypothetical protein